MIYLVTKLATTALAREGRGLKKQLLPLAEEIDTIAAAGLDVEDLRFFRELAEGMERNLKSHD